MVKIAKKIFTMSVVTMTIMWSVGIAALVPMVAVAADECPELQAGDLFKVPGNSAVYFLNADMERMYFPNSEVYHTWYADFLGVDEIPNACVDAYPAPSVAPYGVNYRPGSRMVKVEISPSVYVVEPGNKKTKIGSEEVATALYGANWASKVRDIADVYWPNFAAEGAELTEAALHDGMVVTVDGTANYAVVEGMLYAVDGDASDVQTVSEALFGTLSIADTTVTGASLMANPAQKGASEVVPVEDTETPVVAGNLTVSLSANTPNAGNVVIAVDNVVFGKYILKAGADADVIVNSVKIGRQGLGATADFTSITLYDGTTKLGSTRTSWHSDGYMTYNISGGWTIPAGTSKEITIAGKLANAGKYNSLGILDVSVGSGTVTGAPVYGNQMVGVDVTVGGVTIIGVGSVLSKNIGSTDVNLAKFKLSVDSIENAKFNSITLKNKAATSNAADDNLANMYLYKGTTLLAGPVSMVSDKITFVLDESYPIDKSKNETFTVKGDIVNGVNNTVEFVLDSTTDLNVTGNTYNTQLGVTKTNYTAAAEGGSIITITGAELNVALTSVALETADDQTDVEFGRITLSAGSTDMKISNFQVDVDETDGSDTGGSETGVIDIDDLELVDAVSGAAYSGTDTGSTDGDAVTANWVYTDEIYLTAGETITLIVRGDIPASTTSGYDDSYKLSVNTANITAETVPAGDAISSFSVGTVTGKLITVRRPTMTIKSTAMNAGNAVVNDPNVILFSGTLKATAGDIRFERMLFNSSTVNGLATANWTDIGLYFVDSLGEYTLKQNVTNSNLTAGAVDFNTLDFTILSGATQKFVVKGNLAATNSTTASVVQISLDTVTAKDADNDDVSVVNASGVAIEDGAELSTTRVVTITSKGILYVAMRNADSGFNKDRVLLAGNSAWVGKLRMRADYEDIMVKDLKLTNSSADDEDSITSVCLYTAQSAVIENLIGCTTIDASDIAFFDNINKTVTQGTHDWYIYVTSNNMGNGAAATADSQDLVQFGIVTSTGHLTAQGIASGDEFTYDAGTVNTAEAGEIVFDKDLDGIYSEIADESGTASTTIFYVAGSKISDVQLVSSYGGVTVASTIAGTGSTTLAILAITTEANSNTDANGNPLLLAVDGFSFDMSKYVSTTISGTTVERIGGENGPKNLAFTSLSSGANITDIGEAWTMATVTTTLGADAFIGAGETAYFAVVANINSLATATNLTNWIQVGLNDLKGGVGDADNNIDWFDGYDTTYTVANNYDYLFLNTTSIAGTKISAPKNN
ncbi:MAG: hypothetical protein ABIJ23_05055 [Candidatus Magasanikbacteria bacterium]